MQLSNLLFSVIFGSTVAYFLFNLRKTWTHITSIGQGVEEDRFSLPLQRLQNMMFGGLIQKRMFKDPIPGLMHFAIFWGFVVVSLGTVELVLSGVTNFEFHDFLSDDSLLLKCFFLSQDIANFVVMMAIGFAILRRLFFPPKRFAKLKADSKKDAYVVLSFIFGLVFSAHLALGARTFVGEGALPAQFLPISATIAGMFGNFFGCIDEPARWLVFASGAWWLHVLVLCSFMTFLPFSKHQHLIWVWPNMFFKSLRGSGRIRPMEFKEDAESFGVGAVSAFTWKQLLDGMTCVECGRCSAVCPATTTQKPLDPRLIIHHLKEAMLDAVANPEEKRKPLIGGIVSREELWSCTTCGACMEACPLHIEHIPAIVDMRRYMTLTEGEMPAELQNTLQNLESQGNPWGINNETRADWAKGLDVPLMAQKQDVEYLFWVGCAGSFDERYKKVTQATAKLFKNAGVSFAILGREEKCNGDSARRAGNEYLADMQIRENIETLSRYNVKKVVTGCPHCFNTLKNEYPDFGFKAEVVHHSQLISNLVEQGKLKGVKSQDTSTVTYHDSCYLGRHNSEYESPRQALTKMGSVELKEMPRSKENGFCCGAGGARMWMEETIGERINVNRAKEAIATGAKTIATACPFCMTMMKDGVAAEKKEVEVEVKDIAELVSERLLS